MQGASPLASPGLSRRQHGLTLRNRYPAGACPVGCRLTVPLWCPQGGACLPCRLLAPAFSLLYCPHPPAPLPGGKGEIFTLFRRGLRPRHPGIKPSTALAIPAPGERTISNAEVPLPRSPLSLAAGTAQRKAFPAIRAANHGFSSRGCKGRSPLHKKTIISPPSRREGGGGMGERKQTKGRAGRRQRRQAPLRRPERQGRLAAKKASPPANTAAARSAGDRPLRPHRYKMFTKVRASPP